MRTAIGRLASPGLRAELAGNGAVYAFMDGRPLDAVDAVGHATTAGSARGPGVMWSPSTADGPQTKQWGKACSARC